MDDLEASVKKWRKLLGVEGKVDVRIGDNETPPECQASQVPPRIVLPPDSPEPPLAHEMGHLALAQKYDLCFGQTEIDRRGGADDLFEEQVDIASGCCDLFVDTKVFAAEPAIVDKYLEYELDDLKYYQNAIGEIPKNDVIMLMGLYMVAALAAVKFEAFGKDMSDVMKGMTASAERTYSPHEANKITRLYDLYKQVPPLGDDRFEAVRSYRETTQKTARILGFRVPHLVLSINKDRHLWSKKNK